MYQLSQMEKGNIIIVSRLSLIGGISGGIETLAVLALNRLFPQHSLLLDLLIGGLCFSIVGLGISISCSIAMAALRIERRRLLIGGTICGFISGLFFNFGMFIYLSMFLFSLSFAFLAKALGLPHPVRLFVGAISGALIGFMAATLLIMGWSHLRFLAPFYSIPAILYTIVITYFINFGVLLPLVNVDEG